MTLGHGGPLGYRVDTDDLLDAAIARATSLEPELRPATAEEFERQVNEHGKISLLVFLEDFRGWKPSALWEHIKFDVDHFNDIELRARRLVDTMAIALQASLLIRHAPKAVADAFVASRVGGDYGTNFGTLPPGTDFDALIRRAYG